MKHSEFGKIIHEYFDITDTPTRRHLLSLEESQQNPTLMKLTSKLYEHITSKVSDINFGSVTRSAGDIELIDNYENLVECLRVIRDLLLEQRQSTESVDIVNEAIENLKQRKEKFKLGFKLDDEFVSMIYSTVALGIVSSVGFLISSSIEYIKSPTDDTFDISVDKVALAKTKDSLLFTNLKKFNSSCKKGEMDKVLDHITKQGSKQMLGIVDTYAIMSLVVFSGVALSIIPMMRELIYFFYYSRVQVSDYLDLQAELLQMNAYKLERGGSGDKTDKAIAKKQMAIVKMFKTVSNKVALSSKESEVKTTKELKQDVLKYRADGNTGELTKVDSSLF